MKVEHEGNVPLHRFKARPTIKIQVTELLSEVWKGLASLQCRCIFEMHPLFTVTDAIVDEKAMERAGVSQKWPQGGGI